MPANKLILASLIVAGCAPALAADYRPVTCSSARPYIGLALHSSFNEHLLPTTASISGELDAATIARLEAAATRAFQASGATAMTVAVSRPSVGTWSAVRSASGSPPARFWWASAGKMLAAVTVLRLAEEGRLSLSESISRYVEGVPNGSAITLEHLLTHTSGLFSANEDRRVRERARRLTSAEELEVLRRHGAMFCPGERWRYSNSGYSLLGMVIEKVQERTFAEVTTDLVLTPIGAGSLRVLRPGEAASDVARLASATSESVVQPSWTGPAAPLVGLAEDMNRFLQATLTSNLIQPKTRSGRFARLYPMFDEGSFYGHGIMIYRPLGTNLYWIGHGGGSPGASAISIWSPREQAFVSVALTGDGSAPATANLLLAALGSPTSR